MGKVELKYWFKAARPKTLMVSAASVVMSVAFASFYGKIQWLPALICLVFAVLAQVLSNLVNDYSDGVKGVDPNRIGPAYMVASGFITPKQMRGAITLVAILAFLIGCTLMFWGGWRLLPIGIVILLCAFGYSAGPYPLSEHGLGDLAVLLFYGLIPAVFTFYFQTGFVNYNIVLAGLSIGMVVNNLLILNNIRDVENDLLKGKKTTVGIFGKRTMTLVYYLNPVIAIALGFVFMYGLYPLWGWAIVIVPFAVYSSLLSYTFAKARGVVYNKLMGWTSLEAMLYALTVVVCAIFCAIVF